ncbi:MAG: class I SAM-dependent methyltransferase [Dehalococcoidia bacterium]|nr:MAG: class I SAM-dependent methyltransferase [Dehalococcoidia bacterium]
MTVSSVSVKDLHKHLCFSTPIDYPETSITKALKDWQMEIDDAPIFRYIYRNFRPRRHLEFGTWEGTGLLYCLEECDATVWTINLPQGEKLEDGTRAYASLFEAPRTLHFWSRKKKDTKDRFWYQSDVFGSIGRFYLEADMGNRVCQIYCDSREWDIRNYPPNFFDSVLIDGGHAEDVVASDTTKACQLVRSGGIIMWHDFCEQAEVQNNCSSTEGVVSAVKNNWDWLNQQMSDIFWINPSWILLGVKK